MDAYTSNYLTHGISETLKKLYCPSLTKQQERENKSQQKSFIYHLTSQKSQNPFEIFSQCSISNAQTYHNRSLKN